MAAGARAGAGGTDRRGAREAARDGECGRGGAGVGGDVYCGVHAERGGRGIFAEICAAVPGSDWQDAADQDGIPPGGADEHSDAGVDGRGSARDVGTGERENVRGTFWVVL